MESIEPGTWIRLKKTFGDLSDLAQVVHYEGRAVRLLTDGGDAVLRAREEIALLPEQPTEIFERRRIALPYGKWTCADGRQVLFNRNYKPIWQRASDGSISPGDTEEWVAFAEQEHFYGPDHLPWADENTSELLVAMLGLWAVPLPNLLPTKQKRKRSIQPIG